MRITIALLTLLIPSALASYALQDDYAGSAFAGMFDFFTVSNRSSPQDKANTDRMMIQPMAMSIISLSRKLKALVCTIYKTAPCTWVSTQQILHRDVVEIAYG